MEQYTDDERVEDIKKWWQDNGSSIIIGIGLGLIAIFGWQYWNSYRNTQAEQASQAYDAFIVAAEKPDNDQARQRGQVLLDEFPKSPYAALVALQLATTAIEGGNTASTIQWLEWVVENAKLDELKDIARLRLARVLLATGRLAEVEPHLARVTTARLAAEREELRGDMALISNDTAKARTAYAAAQTASGDNPLVQLKLDNLALPSADSVIPAPSVPTVITPPESAQSGAAVTKPASATPSPSTSEPAQAPEPAPASLPATATEAAPTAEPAPASPPATATEAAPTAEPAPVSPPAASTVTVPPAENTSDPPPAVTPTEAAPVIQPAPGTEPAPTDHAAPPSTSGSGTAPVPAPGTPPTSGQ